MVLVNFLKKIKGEMDILHWYKSWSLDINLKSVLLHCVSVFLFLFKVLCLCSSLKTVMYS